MTEQFKRVGEYRFIRRIGKGATSEVFEAKKEGSNERYAVKMMRLKGLNSQQREIINKQITIIKSINHPNIVNLVDTFQTTNNFYLVFQYCQKGDLEKYLFESYGPRLPEETAQRIMYCIADAVSLIHSKGIAHRDLKLANILLKKDYQIKLADFGFAKQESHKLLMETYCGTPITMAPEIMQSKPYDKKVDIWSLGVITFQLVYGRLPFSTSQGLNKFIQYVKSQPLEIPSQPPMSPDFKQLIICSLQKNPEKRFSITQFMANKWVIEGIENSFTKGGLNKKPSVEQLLKNVSQQVKIEEQVNINSQIQILIAQRVNKLIVSEVHNLIKRHENIRNSLLTRCQNEGLQNLLFKLDYTFIDFIKNMPITIGKEGSTQILKCNELHGVQFTEALSKEEPNCGNPITAIYEYLKKTTSEGVDLEKKLVIYQVSNDLLELSVRFDLRVIVLFANHLCEDFQVGNVIKNITEKKINEQISEDIEFTKGNYITLAMECQDKQAKAKGVRETLCKNIQKRIDEIKKQLGGY